jgi:type IV pilus assembly protein PilB
MVGLAELGMPAETYKTYAKLVHAPFGMVICAGPTGAGKTTTLYATLLEINSTGKNVTTVEDPVYLNGPYIVSPHFKKEPDGSRWDPAPCSSTW